MLSAVVTDVVSYLPGNTLSNDALDAEHPTWGMKAIGEKIGIERRRVAAPDQTALDLAAEACKALFVTGACGRDDIDTLIVCTQSPDFVLPPNSPLLQNRLGLPQQLNAFDISHGCSGYVYGLALAKALIESAQSRNVLFVTAETYSKYIASTDRTVRSIFGDAATATLIKTATADFSHIDHFCYHTDGAGMKNLVVAASGARSVADGKNDNFEYVCKDGTRSKENLYMNGPAIFNFSIKTVPVLLQRTLEAGGLTVADIDFFVFHQANGYMLEHLRLKCDIPEHKFLTYLADVGNTVSSSIPLVLENALITGRIKKNDKIALVGFGVGYSSAACVLTV